MGLKGLRIVVLMNMFDPVDLNEEKDDKRLWKLKGEVRAKCKEIGALDNITLFSSHTVGVILE